MKWTRTPQGLTGLSGDAARKQRSGEGCRRPLISSRRTAPELPQPPKPITRSKEANAAIIAGGAGAIAAAGEAMPAIREGVGIMPVLSESLGRPAFIAALIVIVQPWPSGSGGVSGYWSRGHDAGLDPLTVGRWLSLVGAVFAALSVAWLKGGAAWQGRLAGRSVKLQSQSNHHIFGDST